MADLARMANRAKGVVKRAATAVKDAFCDALFPIDLTCDVCNDELVEEGRFRICSRCYGELPFVGDRICLSCGAPIFGEGDYCMRCQTTPGEYKMCRAPFAYRDSVKTLIYRLKFEKQKFVATTLGAFMAETFINERMDGEIAVFVPMTEGEKKKRGFNQSELLAEDVAARLNMPLLPALVKKKATGEQKSLDKKERQKNLEGAFECVFKEVKGRRILLIDDIFTTGATANECARTLVKAGAKEVSVLTAAITELKMPFEADDKPLVKEDKK